MRNIEVLKKFLEGKASSTPLREIYGEYEKGRTLTTVIYANNLLGNTLVLYNYKEPIAIFYSYSGTLILNQCKYSCTTSKIQNQLYNLALNECIYQFEIIDKKEDLQRLYNTIEFMKTCDDYTLVN